MERIGKVFKMGVKDIGLCRIVDGYVRSKNIKNIARSIDFLDVVTDKLGDRYNDAVAHYPESDIHKGDGWGLLIEQADNLTYFSYTFVNQQTGGVKETAKHDEGQAEGPALNDLDKVLADPDPEPETEVVVEVHPAEQPAVAPVEVKATGKKEEKPKKAKKDDTPKPPKTPKGGAKQDKEEKPKKKAKYSDGVKNFLRRQALKIQAMMAVYYPEQGRAMYPNGIMDAVMA